MSLTKDELLEFINKKLGVDTSGMDDSTLMFSTGMVDSFSLVSLITYIEKQAGFRMSPMDVNLENMDSVERILAYVERKVAENAE